MTILLPSPPLKLMTPPSRTTVPCINLSLQPGRKSGRTFNRPSAVSLQVVLCTYSAAYNFASFLAFLPSIYSGSPWPFHYMMKICCRAAYFPLGGESGGCPGATEPDPVCCCQHTGSGAAQGTECTTQGTRGTMQVECGHIPTSQGHTYSWIPKYICEAATPLIHRVPRGYYRRMCGHISTSQKHTYQVIPK